MADLFDRLISRATGGVRAARPVVDVTDAMFASGEADPEDTPEPTPSAAAADMAPRPPAPVASAPRPPAPVASAPAVMSANAADAAARPARSVTVGAAAHAGGSPESLSRNVPPSAPRPLAGTFVAPGDPTPVQTAPAAPLPTAAAPAPRAWPERAPGAVSAAGPSPLMAPAPGVPAPNPVARTDAAPSQPQPAEMPTARRPSADANPSPRSPRARRMTAARPAAHDPGPPADAAAPVIRISIGRIDVRAAGPAAPPKPTPRPTPAQPQLTLDAFLSRTSAGGRR